MAFVSPCSKLERAVRAFLILQGKATEAATFISNDLRDRTFPNRTILAPHFSSAAPFKQGGIVTFSIQHRFSVAKAPGGNDGNALRVTMDGFIGATVDSMTAGDANSLNLVADALTAAGRWLAKADGTDEGQKIADANADMVNFRCDWLKMGDPFLVRGGKADEKGDFWMEILNFSAFVSQAAN